MKLLPPPLNDKPQYVFHPRRLVRRAMRSIAWEPPEVGEVALARTPWGLELEVYANEAIGYTILNAGIFDPCVSETMFRLIDPGDVVVDVGANIGYLTSLAAARAGAKGNVIAYEPHPRVFELLRSNVERWRAHVGSAHVEIHQSAVSDHAGTASLASGPLFHQNMGLATLQPATTADTELLPVAATRLDEALGDRPVGLIKVDVEGHEPEVLRGARPLLEAGLVRDLVFEDHDPYPDASTELLHDTGYRLFSLDNDLFGIRLGAPSERGEAPAWPGPSYLATREPKRAIARLRPRGWRIKGIGPTAPSWARRRRRR
jgi:FkbM family methyltransferase